MDDKEAAKERGIAILEGLLRGAPDKNAPQKDKPKEKPRE